MSKYTELVARLTLTEVLPALAGERYADVRALDAERVRIAAEYAAIDGLLLRKIRHRLMAEPGGAWGKYRDARALPGYSTYDRLHLAERQPVAVAQWNSQAVHAWTHCNGCGRVFSACTCPTEEDLRAERAADDAREARATMDIGA